MGEEDPAEEDRTFTPADSRYFQNGDDTRHRVHAKAVHDFNRGGMVTKIPFGYRKLTVEESLSAKFGSPGLRMAKLSEWTPTLQGMKARVLQRDTYASVAAWLNESGIPTGPYAKTKYWTTAVRLKVE